MKKCKQDRIFDLSVTIVLALVALIVFYPLYFVVISSFSDPDFVNAGKVTFWIRGFTLEGYERLLAETTLWHGYANSLIYTCFGTLLAVTLTVCAAFGLSRTELPGHKVLMGLFVFIMYFNGGLIPLYIIVNKLGLYNTPYTLIVLGAFSSYNFIIARTFFCNTIPRDLLEAARIDGCGDLRYFLTIVLPLSKAIIAVLCVYYGVAYWNTYFNALIFIVDEKYRPLQMVLREILNATQQVAVSVSESALEELMERQRFAEMIKYGMILAASLPMLLIYPFAQKFFIKGVMIGSVKG